MIPIHAILSSVTPGVELPLRAIAASEKDFSAKNYDGQEEWQAIDQYRSSLLSAGVDLSDFDLEEAIAGYPYNVEAGILKFLRSADKSDPTNNLIFCIKQGEQP